MKRLLPLLLIAALTGCVTAERAIVRIALVAPFEGRYREVGYNALYAARMALADSGSAVQLLAVDDGGDTDRAAERLRALADDESVVALILLGHAVTSPAAQAALGDLPAIVVGTWTETRETDSVFIATSSRGTSLLTQPVTTPLTVVAAMMQPVVVAETGGLEGFQRLRTAEQPPAILITSGSPPSDAFAQRYLSSGLYVPPPNHLATLTYDISAWLARLTSQADIGRGEITRNLTSAQYDSTYSGSIAFGADGFWINAPLHAFRIESGALTPVALDDVID